MFGVDAITKLQQIVVKVRLVCAESKLSVPIFDDRFLRVLYYMLSFQPVECALWTAHGTKMKV